MKLVCDACQSKYAISDDKVRGKVFKIRCKKCSNVIVVRGTADTAEPPPPDTAADDGWYAVIDQAQVGPLAASEIERRCAAGELDGDTYVWREGMADWLPLAEVAAFASLVTSAPTSSPVPPEPEAGDLFGAPSPSRAASDAQAGRLRGERNESSVLFSLNELTELAAPLPRTHAAATAAAPGTEGSGLIDIRSMASAYLGPSGTAKPASPSAGIGSIDDLPVFAGTGFSEPAVIVPFAARSPRPKLLYAAIGASALAVVAAVIVVIVVVRDRPASANSAPTIAAADPSAHTARATGDTHANGATNESHGSSATGESHANGATSESHTGGTTNESHTGDTTNESHGSTATSESHTGGTTNESHRNSTTSESHANGATSESHGSSATSESRANASHPSSAAGDSRAHPNAAHARASADPAHANARRGDVSHADTTPHGNPLATAGAADSCDQVHCMVSGDDPCCARFQHGAEAAPAHAASSNLPEKLDRGMIKDGVGKVMGKAQACGGKSSARGTVRIAVKVDGEGRIASAMVRETPEPALGDCVLAAMKQASFAKTQAGGSFAFPFVF